MTLSPQAATKTTGTGARVVPEGECWPGRAGPGQLSRRRGQAAVPAGLPAGAAAHLPRLSSGWFRLPDPDAGYLSLAYT